MGDSTTVYIPCLGDNDYYNNKDEDNNEDPCEDGSYDSGVSIISIAVVIVVGWGVVRVGVGVRVAV